MNVSYGLIPLIPGKVSRLFVLSFVLVIGFSCLDRPEPTTQCHTLCVQWEKEKARLDSVMYRLDSDFERTTFLREYCAGLIDFGIADPDSAAYYNSIPIEALELDVLYDAFLHNRYAVECGLTSLFYVKLAHQYGYKAYQYSFGFTEKPYSKYIHSFPLVEILEGNHPKMIVQDPYLNLTFKGNEGVPLDYFDFLSRVVRGEFDRIIMDSTTAMTTLCISDTTDLMAILPDSCQTMLRTIMINQPGGMRSRMPVARNYRNLMQSECHSFEMGFLEAMKAQGIEEPFLFAYTLTANTMTGSDDANLLQKRIEAYLRDLKAERRRTAR